MPEHRFQTNWFENRFQEALIVCQIYHLNFNIEINNRDGIMYELSIKEPISLQIVHRSHAQSSKLAN